MTMLIFFVMVGYFAVQITPGSLPKGLHVLDLSKNKIASIEGLRELTRLRVLYLNYNRISRIGHGNLQSFTLTYGIDKYINGRPYMTNRST